MIEKFFDYFLVQGRNIKKRKGKIIDQTSEKIPSLWLARAFKPIRGKRTPGLERERERERENR